MELILPHDGFGWVSLSRGLLGVIVLLIITYSLSSDRKRIPWKTVVLGLLAQFLIALGVLKVALLKQLFEGLGGFFINILEYTQTGTRMLLGNFVNVDRYGFIFVFQALPVIVFFSALTSVLYYFGIIQRVVKLLAWVLSRLLKISGTESLAVAANIFMGQTEAPLLIKGYLKRMTRSELFLVMVGGMATVAGSVMGAYISFLGGNDPEMQLYYAQNLLAASVMAAPGAVVISKMIYPQTEAISDEIQISREEIGSNFLTALSSGTSEGVRMAVNVAGMLLVFIAMIALVNGLFGALGEVGGINDWITSHTTYESLSVEFLLGYLFAPLIWLLGVAYEDSTLIGQLLGIKIVASEFVAYTQLAELQSVANSLHFQYQKSIVMATYMLCGFANFASIGIQIGGIGIIAPSKRKMLTELGLRAMIGGTLVSLLSATLAGMILG